jgi:hypothetical protein
MTFMTVELPKDVAQEYYNASEKLRSALNLDKPPTAQMLMRFMLAGFTSDDVADHFTRALRNITGAPMPDEPDVYVFAPGFEDAP